MFMYDEMFIFVIKYLISFHLFRHSNAVHEMGGEVSITEITIHVYVCELERPRHC